MIYSRGFNVNFQEWPGSSFTTPVAMDLWIPWIPLLRVIYRIGRSSRLD